jgi:hypothetical protein
MGTPEVRAGTTCYLDVNAQSSRHRAEGAICYETAGTSNRV